MDHARDRHAAARHASTGIDGTGVDATVAAGAETGAVRTHDHGHVRRLVLADGARRNLLTEEMMAALEKALIAARDNANVRVIVIAGEGPAFSAGHDLKRMCEHYADPDRGSAYFEGLFRQCSRLMMLLPEIDKPIIAEVATVAVAAGCQLVAAADLAVASETARFGTTGVTFGLFCSTPMVPLSRGVHRKAALEMLFTGDLVSATHAREIGLVNRVVPAERLTEETMALATAIASKSPKVLAMGKRAYYAQIDMGLGAAYTHAASVMVENLLAEDGEEGLTSFREKRPPVWTGR